MSPITLHLPILMQPATGDPSLVTTGQEFREFTRHTLSLSDVAGAQGVVSSIAYQVTQRGAGANLSVDVASGGAFVVGDDVTSQGTYHVWNDGTVNVPGLTVPGSGTYHHRIVLQVQDKLNNGTWTGYQAALTPLLDTGGGLPAEPNSAITLATVDVPSGSASVTNAMISDFRILLGGALVAVSTADRAVTSTVALADDPVLQLLNLANAARYQITAGIFYTGGSGGSEGDLKYTFRVPAGAAGTYAVRQNAIAGNFQQVVSAWANTNTAGTTGTGNTLACVFEGQYQPGSNRPAYLVLQWAQNSSSGTATTVKAGSYLVARRLT